VQIGLLVDRCLLNSNISYPWNYQENPFKFKRLDPLFAIHLGFLEYYRTITCAWVSHTQDFLSQLTRYGVQIFDILHKFWKIRLTFFTFCQRCFVNTSHYQYLKKGWLCLRCLNLRYFLSSSLNQWNLQFSGDTKKISQSKLIIFSTPIISLTIFGRWTKTHCMHMMYHKKRICHAIWFNSRKRSKKIVLLGIKYVKISEWFFTLIYVKRGFLCYCAKAWLD